MIEEMPRNRQPYLHRVKNRHGNMVWQVRAPNGARGRRTLQAPYGSDEFWAEYQEAVKAFGGKPSRKPLSGSLKWLYEEYRKSAAWKALSPATRRQRENIFLHVMEKAGQEPFKAITRASIEAGKEDRSETPAQARNFLDAMRGLFAWAKGAEKIAEDPTEAVKNPKRDTGDGFLAWTEADVAKFEAHWGPSTRERLWLRILLYIGCRRGDAVQLCGINVKNGIITFTTEKGRRSRRIDVSRRIEPELKEVLDGCPRSERFIPMTKESFGNAFKRACVEVGILDKSAHGLRKLSAQIWAERGATTHELMAMFGWLTVQMAELYTRAAERKRLAINAHDRLLGTTLEPNSDAPNLATDLPEKSASVSK